MHLLPSVSEILRVLMKIRQDQTMVIDIIPFWPHCGFTQLLQMSPGPYWKLPPRQTLVSIVVHIYRDLEVVRSLVGGGLSDRFL